MPRGFQDRAPAPHGRAFRLPAIDRAAWVGWIIAMKAPVWYQRESPAKSAPSTGSLPECHALGVVDAMRRYCATKMLFSGTAGVRKSDCSVIQHIGIADNRRSL